MPDLQNRIEQYQQGEFAQKWKGCQAFEDHHSMLQSAAKPDGVVLGVPPAVHGMCCLWQTDSLVSVV